MKKVLFFVLAIFICGSLFSQQPRVAVAPFDVISGVSPEDAETITDAFFNRLFTTRQVSLVDRSIVQQVLIEHGWQLDDWSDKEKTAEIGKALSANWIVRGDIRSFGGGIFIQVRFYDLNTFEFEGAHDSVLTNAREAYNNMGPFVDKLVQTIGGSGGVNRTQAGQAPANMVLVEGGAFTMGSPLTEYGRMEHEGPRHQVTVSSFYMAKYMVTERDYRDLMGRLANSYSRRADNFPATCTWYDAILFCNALSRKEGLTPCYRGSGDEIICDWNANGYRLPTEAEWEYAAKGGNKDLVIFRFSGSNDADTVAWYYNNSGKYSVPGAASEVGLKAPNSLGIYDMSGLRSEWCWDWYGSYTGSAVTNPHGPNSGGNPSQWDDSPSRIVRGGGVLNSERGIRSSRRWGDHPGNSWNNGLRIVRNQF